MKFQPLEVQPMKSIARREPEPEQDLDLPQTISPNSTAVLVLMLGLSGLILLSSALFSFSAIASVGAWAQPQWAWLEWVVPFFIEFFIMYFSVDYIYRVYNRFPGAVNSLWWMIGFSAIAVLGNAAHTVSEWGISAFSGAFEPWVGVIFSGLAPLGIVLITKKVSSLVFERRDS